MPSVITNAFAEWSANKIVAGEAAVPDKMIFALIPGQDSTAEVDPDEGMPETSQISYITDIAHIGKLNENAVVYSAVLDTTIGDWSYNWVGVVDSATGTVLMVLHCDEQKKLRTAAGQQGNNLIRNMVMEFVGAAEATQINVTAETWQIDYSLRLQSSDEAGRLALVDMYGDAAFNAGGFLATAAGGAVSIAPGLAYIRGLRVEMHEPAGIENLIDSGVWIDATWSGTVTGAWAHTFSIRVADSLSDYVDSAGFQHYVAQIAEVSDGVITDKRLPFPFQRPDNCPHRVNDVLLTCSSVNPAVSWPGTVWTDMSGEYNARALMIGAEPLATGGADEVTLSEQNLAPHRHGVSGVTIDGAGEHSHEYERYQPDGTIDTTRVSIDNKTHGNVKRQTGSSGWHSHTMSGSIDSAGSAAPFSIVSRFVTLRGWLRVA